MPVNHDDLLRIDRAIRTSPIPTTKLAVKLVDALQEQIRALQAENERLAGELRYERSTVEGYRGALASVKADLARVTAERDAARLALTHGEALAIERENQLRAQLAALAPRAEALEMLKDARPSSFGCVEIWRKLNGLWNVVVLTSNSPLAIIADEEHPDLASAIRAAVGKAGG
jgi:hypothetical protein